MGGASETLALSESLARDSVEQVERRARPGHRCSTVSRLEVRLAAVSAGSRVQGVSTRGRASVSSLQARCDYEVCVRRLPGSAPVTSSWASLRWKQNWQATGLAEIATGFI